MGGVDGVGRSTGRRQAQLTWIGLASQHAGGLAAPTLDTAAFEARLCVNEAGRVESVLPLRSTGFLGYDRDLLAGMALWVYSPYMIDGEPVPVCSLITFLYTQR